MALQRNNGIDLLKVGLAISVVLLHLNFFSFLNEYWFRVIKDGLLRIGVPTFFVISGYYFKYQTWQTLGVWCLRLARIYVTWMIIYLPFWFDASDPFSWDNVILAFLSYFHLWYLTALLLAGLMLFLLRKQSSRLIILIILMLVVTGFFVQMHTLDPLIFGYKNPLCCPKQPYFSRNALFVGLPFLAMGFLIKRHEQSTKTYQKWNGLCLIFAFILLFAEANYYRQIGVKHGLDILLSLTLVAPILFIWAKQYVGDKVQRWTIDPNFALAIYLVHIMIIAFVRIIEIEPKILSDLVSIGCVFIGSVLLVRVNKRVPIL